MRKYLNESDIRKRLTNLCVICDTREVVNDHLINWLDKTTSNT